MELANFKGEIKKNEPLSRHTSYGIGGPVDMLAYPEDRDDLVALLAEIKKRKWPHLILGGGTNLLVRDGGYRGVMINLKRMAEIRTEREYRSVGGTFTVVHADAGASLAKLLTYSIEQGLTGLEFTAGIPGTVGGAICMNAGTAMGEIGDIVESVTLLREDGTEVKRTREEMAFSYRVSSIPPGHLVLAVRLVLRHDDKSSVKNRVKELMDKRKEYQPWGMPSAGSVFKNPMEESAGKLIETAGLKGRKVGDAQVSEKHANFIVNLGKATAKDVLTLMEIVKQTVLDVHGVRLEPEIKILGDDRS